MFNSIFGGENQNTISIWIFLLCILISLIDGLIYFLSFSIKNSGKKSFKTALFFLPTVVCAVIMMVSGNIGIGVAIAGAFSLVRFRSSQGNAKEICLIFMSMVSGLITGVGYLAYSILFSIIMCVLIVCSDLIKNENKTLKITIPEDLNYDEVFKDILEEFTTKYELIQVKTSSLGSLYKLKYSIKLRKGVNEKQLIDKLRVRNGNLEILILKEEEENEL